MRKPEIEKIETLGTSKIEILGISENFIAGFIYKTSDNTSQKKLQAKFVKLHKKLARIEFILKSKNKQPIIYFLFSSN